MSLKDKINDFLDYMLLKVLGVDVNEDEEKNFWEGRESKCKVYYIEDYRKKLKGK